MAELITAGHINAYTYRWHSFVIALNSVAKQRQEKIIDLSIAVRASNMEVKDFNKFAGINPMSHDEIYKKHKADEL